MKVYSSFEQTILMMNESETNESADAGCSAKSDYPTLDLGPKPECPATQAAISTGAEVPHESHAVESSENKPAIVKESDTRLILAKHIEEVTKTSGSEEQLGSFNENTKKPLNPEEPSSEKNLEDKCVIYKGLAIKLKKELVKCREELNREELENRVLQDKLAKLTQRYDALENTAATDRFKSESEICALKARIKELKRSLEIAEGDIENLQTGFENYKEMAVKMMQKDENADKAKLLTRTSEEERAMKIIRNANEALKKEISKTGLQLISYTERNRELETELGSLKDKIACLKQRIGDCEAAERRCVALEDENKGLKLVLEQFKARYSSNMDVLDQSSDYVMVQPESIQDGRCEFSGAPREDGPEAASEDKSIQKLLLDEHPRDFLSQKSPTSSIKDGLATNSSSSTDISTSGFVHIKPAGYEFAHRKDVMEVMKDELNSVTKAFIDSENTNSLLSDQVTILKEEIRRLQLGQERMSLAENLEYLKNVVFKFLTLDSNQIKEKQSLVPVLSTVLRLSKKETEILDSVVANDKNTHVLVKSFEKALLYRSND